MTAAQSKLSWENVSMKRANGCVRGTLRLFGMALLLNGCRQDMHNQPKFYPQRGTEFYRDGRSARSQVPGTVARSQSDDRRSYFYTGMTGQAEGDGMTLPVTLELVERGQERFNIYCSPCHSRVGNGKGMIVQRGYYAATNLHSERLRQAPLGHFFFVMTNGYGAMPNYAAELTPSDRWAVVAYIRALQLSQHASTATDLPPGINPQSVTDLAVQSGLSRNFLNDWLPRQLPAPIQRPLAVMSALSGPIAANGLSAPTTAEQLPMAKLQGTGKNLTIWSEAATAGVEKSAVNADAPALKPPVSKPDAARGESIYTVNCGMCHQKTRAGMPPVIPSLIDVIGRVGEERVRFVSRNGIPEAKIPMPAHQNLSDNDLDDLIAFLKKN